MVLCERVDFRVFEKKFPMFGIRGETADERLGRLDKPEAIRKGIPLPATVFVRRRDGLLKELPRVFDDMLFTYDGARVERVLECAERLSVGHKARKFAFDGITRALDEDAKVLSLLSGESSESDYGDSSPEPVLNGSQGGWADKLRKQVSSFEDSWCYVADVCLGFSLMLSVFGD